MKSIPGTTTMLVGPTGAGKTHSLRTLCDAGITPFVLFTEPGMRTLSDISCDKLHYKYVPPATPTWDALLDNAKKINTLSFKALTQMGDMNKQAYGQFLEVITTMNNFTCDRCGESFGDVATWRTDRAICIDSLSGLNIMAMDMVVGAKPVKAVGDWGVAMDNLERFINTMTNNTFCHFVLTAHLEREQDEVSGAVHLMASTLGKKLAPKVPRFFDDVVLCENREGKFTWATVSSNVDLKWRNLSGGKDLPPSFVPLIESWTGAGGLIEPTISAKDIA
jgi:hypothetical protein